MRIHIRIMYTVLFLVGIVYLSGTRTELFNLAQTPLTLIASLFFSFILTLSGLYGITRPDYMDSPK